jgi:hypothetical protein
MKKTTNHSNTEKTNLAKKGSVAKIWKENKKSLVKNLTTKDNTYLLPARIEDINLKNIETILKNDLWTLFEQVGENKTENRNKNIWEKVIENFDIIKKSNIQWDTTIPFNINHPLYKLLLCKNYLLKNILDMATMIDINSDRHLIRIEHAFFKKREELFFHKELFEECIEYFWLDEIKNIFAYDNLPPTSIDNWNVPHATSGKTIYQRMEQWCAIIDFCTHTGFPMWLGHMPASLFLDGIKEADLDRWEVHYLWSFAPEVRYFIEKIWIPFDQLFALPGKKIATHCWIIRSLQQIAYDWKETTWERKNLSFQIGRKANEIGVEEIFSRSNIFDYINAGYSLEKLIDLCYFIKNQKTFTNIPQLDNNLQLASSPLAVNAVKFFVKIKNNIGELPQLQNIDRDHIAKDSNPKIPAFLENEKIHNASQRWKDMKVIIKDSITLNTLDRNAILTWNEKIPTFLSSENLRDSIKKYNKICNITKSNPVIDRNICLVDETRIPLYIQDDNFVEQLYEYSNIARYLESNSRYQNINRQVYYENPSLLKSLIEKIKKTAASPLKNIGIISALSKNLQIGDAIWYPILGQWDNGNKVDLFMKDSRSIVRKYREMYENHMGLYSIGGKIHVDTPIPEEDIQRFIKETWLKQTAFKLIHANTSILLPPSYFAAELMFMIARMSDNGVLWQHGLFADNEKPQLQIAIPWRLPNELWAILWSSMILLSQKHLDYSMDSFSTSHNSETWRRMVTYDAGVYDPTFTWNSDKIDGRTDVLLLRDINLMPKAQIIGSLLWQTKYDGMFAELGEQFIREYCELLDKHGLYSMLQQPWIYDSKSSKDDNNLEEHFHAVKSFTDRQHMDRFLFNTTQQHKWLLVFEIHNLLTKYWEKIKLRQQDFR